MGNLRGRSVQARAHGAVLATHGCPLAVGLVRQLLTSMHNWTRTRNLDFALIIIPLPVEVLPTEKQRSVAAQKFGLSDLDYPVHRIARLAAENEIPFVNLLSPLR